jgi:two-component system cell cycle response regulator
MKSFAVDVQSLLTVAAAVLDQRGVLLGGNAGFLRLMPAQMEKPVGTRVARCFIQPSFAELWETAARDPQGYSGLLTLGDYDNRSWTFRGRAWRADGTLRVLAEYEIADLEKLAESVLQLNREANIAQSELTRQNVGLRQHEAEIIATSLTDPLTGVGNRRRLEQGLAAEINRSGRAGTGLCVIMADLDHFKRVNDEHGHSTGDQVLMRFGALLKELTRPTDIVARYGGEEFFVVLPHTSMAQAVLRAESIRSAWAGMRIEPLPAPSTASFGVAQLMDHESPEGILARVDAALYQAKKSGRNRVTAAISPEVANGAGAHLPAAVAAGKLRTDPNH